MHPEPKPRKKRDENVTVSETDCLGWTVAVSKRKGGRFRAAAERVFPNPEGCGHTHAYELASCFDTAESAALEIKGFLDGSIRAAGGIAIIEKAGKRRTDAYVMMCLGDRD
jgi:hypothetical protein